MTERPNTIGDEAGRPVSGDIADVALLDLTGMTSPDDLAGVRSIKRVATILVPENLMSALLAIPMEAVASTIPVPTGENVKLMTGQMTLTGDALADPGGGEDVLVVAGQLIFTSPVERIGYSKTIVTGQVLAPRGSEGAIATGVTRLIGQTLFYSGTPKFFVGSDSFGPAFFELLDEPVTLVLIGNHTIEPGVTVDLFKKKVTQIVLAGNVEAPAELVPLLQILAEHKAGTISVLEDG